MAWLVKLTGTRSPDGDMRRVLERLSEDVLERREPSGVDVGEPGTHLTHEVVIPQDRFGLRLDRRRYQADLDSGDAGEHGSGCGASVSPERGHRGPGRRPSE